MKMTKFLALGVGILFSVTACSGSGGVARTFGLTKEAPDEFLVRKTKPLVFPTQTAVLPVPGERSTETAALESANTILTAPAASTTSTPRSAEAALLEEAASNARSNPAGVDTSETAEKTREQIIVESSLFGDPFGAYDDDLGESVDPEAELQRLRDEGLIAPES